MSKTDRIKEEIGWLKVIFGILVATDISLIAWLSQNFSSPNRFQALVALVTVAFVTVAVVLVNHRAYTRIKQLEDL